MIVLLLLILALFGYWAYWRARAQRMDQMTSALPSPPALPLIGNAMLFLGSSRKIRKNLEYIANLGSMHRGTVKLWIGPKLYVALGNPIDIRVVLENCLEKDGSYSFLQPWLGNGLFIAPVDMWKVHRKAMLPIFHHKVVEDFIGVIAEQVEVLVENLNEQVDKREFDVLSYITACTLDIVFETAMGERMDVQKSPNTPYIRARLTILKILNMRIFKLWMQPDCLFNLTSYAKTQKENIDITHKFTNEVILKRRMEHANKKNNNVEEQIEDKGKVQSLLDRLFGHEVEFTNEQLREQIDTFTIAGNDTTAMVIAYTLTLLGIHQDAQQRVLKEQESIFGKSKKSATKEDLRKMCYLERVIKESMRLYTVIPIIARKIDKDIYLPGSRVTVPAGTGAVVGAFAVHRSKFLWGPTANEFDPDRFLPERSVKRHPAAFLSFSYGSRNCIGRHFGMLIMKSMISSVVRSYRIEADKIGPLKLEMLLFPIKGHQIRIAKR